MKQHVFEVADKWLNSNISNKEKSEIQALIDSSDHTELEDAFYKYLEFGTGGLRGVMGIGSNRMNKYTLGITTQGLANYLQKTYPDEQVKVAIACDSRNNSEYFAGITADVFSANGIEVYLFAEPRPTPQLSFAIRHFGCHGGVVITASHNPKEYNGYKAYCNDGAQLTPPHDQNAINEVNLIEHIDEIDFTRNKSLVRIIDPTLDDIYINEIKKVCLSADLVKKHRDISIVYSSLHGTGITLIPKCLKILGFNNVSLVEEQVETDGNFPTVIYPNPEEAEAMTLALLQAQKVNAEVVMATDPDTDRVGIAVKNNQNKFVLLNGNQTGSLMILYILRRLQQQNRIPDKGYIVKTIVTTDLISKISQWFGVECMETLTGFKYIAALIRDLADTRKYIAGGEESCGYLIGDFVRDKDAVTSCAIIAEMTAYAKAHHLSLYEMMVEMYQEFGLYHEDLMSITKKGAKGAEEIGEMMQAYRQSPPKFINGSKVIQTMDYLTGEKINPATRAVEKLNFPPSNVLQFITEDGSKISVRPSGTEPKIKFYFSVLGEITTSYEDARGELMDKVTAIQKDMKLLTYCK